MGRISLTKTELIEAVQQVDEANDCIQSGCVRALDSLGSSIGADEGTDNGETSSTSADAKGEQLIPWEAVDEEERHEPCAKCDNAPSDLIEQLFVGVEA